MKVPLSWLKDFLPLKATPQEIAEALTSLGIEVEKIGGTAATFSGVVVGKVLQADQHPNADRLRVARVTDGTKEYQVVCGAPNCRAGITVALARVGAELTDEEGKRFKIKKSKLRDVESEGMLCAADELSLGQEASGIMELSSEMTLGEDLSHLAADPVFDVSLTPNLGHCFSMLGIARELASYYKMEANPPSHRVTETGNLSMSVEVADPKLCPRYTCRMMTNVQVRPSPEWLQKKLLACGIRPINNLVDIANYVMLEVGQPLHIFDADRIQGKRLLISAKEESFSFETLDGQKREIFPGTLLIQDEEKPLAIAGIMGGLSSAATENTKNIVIESACFDPTSIRRSSRRLDLKTDASSRFEKGIDAGAVAAALNRAAALIQEMAGGDIHPVVDLSAQPFNPRTIPCRLSRLEKLLGFPLSLGEVVALLERLRMRVKVLDSQILEVTVPTDRNDLQQEIDLVEEVARLFGYNHIPRQRPSYKGSDLPDAPLFRLEKQARQLLLNQGLQECITCNLISPHLSNVTLEKGIENKTIAVLHPRSIDQSVLRSSLLPGLLQMVKLNLNHQTDQISAFEIGRIHFREQETYQEMSCAGIILTGLSHPHHFDRKPSEYDFFDLKGMIEILCEELRLTRYTFEPSHLHTLHPWRQAKIQCGNETVGILGEIHPELLAKFDISHRLFFAELNLSDLLTLKKKSPFYSQLPAFPSSSWDWTIKLKQSVPIQLVLQTIAKEKSPILEDVYLFDLYKSEALGPEYCNATFRFVYLDRTKTLEDEIVKQEHERLTHSVAKKLQDHV